MTKKDILIVEDNRVVAEGIKLILNKIGYNVCAIVASGEEITATANKMKPDLVLMNIMLKGKMNGIDTAGIIKDQLDIPVIYLTAYADENILKRANKTEPNGYIINPFDEEELKATIEIALYKHRMARKLEDSREWFEITLNSIGDAVIATNPEGIVSFMNPVAEELTGWKQADATCEPLSEVFHIVNEYTREPADNPVQKVIESGLVMDLANHTLLISKEGKEIPIKDSGAPIISSRGELVGVVLVFQDITEVRATEDALKESEAYYRSLISNLHEDILVIDRNYNITDVNNSFLVATGHSREEVINQPCYKISHAFAQPCKEYGEPCSLNDVFESGEPGNCIHVHQKKDGSKVYVDIILSPLKDKNGKVQRVIEAVRDITELMNAKTASQKIEEKYRTLVESSTDSILLLDQNRNIASCNRAFLDLFGHEIDEIKGKSVRILHPSEQSYKDLAKLSYSSVEAFGSYRTEWEYCRKDGSKVPVEITISKIKTSESSNGGYVAIMRDITERRQAEEARILLETAINQTAECIVITDSSGKIQYVNPAFEQITGYTQKETIKQNPKILQSGKHDEAFYKSMWSLLSRGMIWQGHFINKRKDGTQYEEDATITPIKNVEGEITNYVAVKRDVTDKIKREKQFRQAQKMEALGTLAGGIAHDFNNILTAIIGYSEIALGKVDQDSTLHSYLQEVFNAGFRAKDLVNQILTFSRQAEQELQPVQVKLIVKEALKLLRASLSTTIEIQEKIRSDKLVLADPTQIHQIIMNLCTNASHAMRKKGGILEVSLVDEHLDTTFSTRYPDITPGAYLKLGVSDTGHGIPSENLGKIFDPFFTTKEREEGTGLGLAAVDGIVRGNGGTIVVYSERNKGTTFNVYLPVIEASTQPQIIKTEPLPTGTEHVLFVDDEKALVDLGREMLEPQGYVITTRTSSIEARELFKSKPDEFDIVVTDMNMPNMTGKDLAAEIMRIRPNTPVIICTGFSEQMTPEAAKTAGIRAFIRKPIISAELITTIRKELNNLFSK